MRKLEKEQKRRALLKAKEAKRNRLQELAKALIDDSDLLNNDFEVNVLYDHDMQLI